MVHKITEKLNNKKYQKKLNPKWFLNKRERSLVGGRGCRIKLYGAKGVEGREGWKIINSWNYRKGRGSKKIGLSKALMQGNLIAVAYTLRTYWN